MHGTREDMADFEIQTQGDSFYQIAVSGHFKDADMDYLGKLLATAYNQHLPCYMTIDLTQYHVLPIQKLGMTILRFYRGNSFPNIYVAILVQPSIAQVLGTIINTLMRRDMVQTFTSLERAKQWLNLEYSRQA